MADLKLIDIPKTMEFDGAYLAENEPALLTVMAQATPAGMQAAQLGMGQREQETLAMITEGCPETETLAVTVLTSQGGEQCQEIYRRETAQAVEDFARMASMAGVGGLVLSGKEVPLVRRLELDPPLTLNAPGIRPTFTIIEGDDQDPDRIVTPAKAIQNGVDRMVIGRPITTAGPNDQGKPQSPREAVELILEEIQEALQQ